MPLGKPSETHLLLRELEDLHSEMLSLVNENLPIIAEVHQENRTSATNLLHYLALRRRDVRRLQERLAALGAVLTWANRSSHLERGPGRNECACKLRGIRAACAAAA